MFSRYGCLKALGVGAALFLVLRLAYRLCAGSIPVTTLPVQHLPEKQAQVVAKAIWKAHLYAPDFPLTSPHRQYEVVFGESLKCGPFHRSILWLVETTTGKRLGFYSFRDVLISGWAKEGRGFYIADYIPGGGPLLWDIGPNIPGYLGPAKVVLVPCRAPLKGVRLLPRMYWGMRCLFPDPFHPLAVWVPLVVTVLGVGAAIGYGYRLWRTPGVQSRVEKGLERLDRWWQNLKWRLFMRL